MKKCWIVPLALFAMLSIGCAGGNKMRVPFAAIDRPIIDPKGTWHASPSIGGGIGVSVLAQDTFAYRGVGLSGLILPSMGYSLTDNLALSIYPYQKLSASLVWQLTKSPLIDTTVRYKWQFALSGRMQYINRDAIYSTINFICKKRLAPSVWYTGGFYTLQGYTAGYIGFPAVSSGIGFQLSPKADVTPSVTLEYAGRVLAFYHIVFNKDNFIGTGSFNFHYSFSEWFSFALGTEFSISKLTTLMGATIGGTFYW
jgi:hypothetical protein